MAPSNNNNVHSDEIKETSYDTALEKDMSSSTSNQTNMPSNIEKQHFISSVSLPFNKVNEAPKLSKAMSENFETNHAFLSYNNDTTLINNNTNTNTNSNEDNDRKQNIMIDFTRDSMKSQDINENHDTNHVTYIPNDGGKIIIDKRHSVNMTIHSTPYTPTSCTSASIHNHRRPSQIDRKLTFESIQSSILFKASAHRSQIFPISDTNERFDDTLHDTEKSINSTALNSNETNKTLSTSTDSSDTMDSSINDIFNDSYSVMQSLLHSNQSNTIVNDISMGHRIDKDNTNFNIVQKMLIGIKVSCEKIDDDMNSFRRKKNDIDKYIFDENGQLIDKQNDRNFSNNINNSNNNSNYKKIIKNNDKYILNNNKRKYSFKFKDYFGYKFSQLRQFYNINEKEYIDSLTSQRLLNELNSPGKSGSFFYFSKDYKYIIKTIHHSEHLHLRKYLKQYINHMLINRESLICQYYGLYRIKLPTSFSKRTNIINRRIYLVVMNNVFPPRININTIFDLKGSLTGRFTMIHDGDFNNGNNDKSQIVKKDLNWLNENGRIIFKDKIEMQKFLKQLRKDTEILVKTNTMDYSLLIGIYNLNDEDSLKQLEYTMKVDDKCQTYYIIKNDDVIYFLGIIDCLTNYSIAKKLETIWRSISNKFDEISAIPPRQYGDRFYNFISQSVILKESGKQY